MPSGTNKEQERLQRIREEQLRARDPGSSKIRGYDWSSHSKRAKAVQKSRQKPLLVELYDVLPGRWKGALNGLIFGIAVAVILGIVLPTEWDILVLVPLLFAAIIGFVLGSVLAKQRAP